jgi:hypothetical protein
MGIAYVLETELSSVGTDIGVNIPGHMFQSRSCLCTRYFTIKRIVRHIRISVMEEENSRLAISIDVSSLDTAWRCGLHQ